MSRGWRVVLFAAVCLSTGVLTAPISGVEDRVEVQCISEYRQYCGDKPNEFTFNDGCRECKCVNGAALCEKGGCRYFAKPDQDILDYCESVYQKNAQRLDIKKKQISKDGRSLTATKVDLDSGRPDELSEKERSEAAMKIQGLFDSYISNQSNEIATGVSEEVQQQTKQGKPVLDAGEDGRSGVGQPRLESDKVHLSNGNLERDVSKVATKGVLPYPLSSGDESYVPLLISPSHRGTSRFHDQESYSTEKLSQKSFSSNGSHRRRKNFWKRHPKYNREYGTVGLVDGRPAFHTFPRPDERYHEDLPNGNPMKGSWNEPYDTHDILTAAAHRRRHSLPKDLGRRQRHLFASPRKWLPTGRKGLREQSSGFGGYYYSMPVEHYETLKHLARRDSRDHRRHPWASSPYPRYAGKRGSFGGKMGPSDVEIKSTGYAGVIKSPEFVEPTRRRAYSHYAQPREAETREKFDEVMKEIKTFTDLNRMAVNMLSTENTSQHDLKAVDTRNTSEFKRIMSAIEENIQEIEVELQEFDLPTSVENYPNVLGRLHHLVELTGKASAMLGDSDAPSENVKNHQLEGILMAMDDIASMVSTSVDEVLEAEELNDIGGTPHSEEIFPLYDGDGVGGGSPETSESAILRRKLARCMMTCSRYL